MNKNDFKITNLSVSYDLQNINNYENIEDIIGIDLDPSGGLYTVNGVCYINDNDIITFDFEHYFKLIR